MGESSSRSSCLQSRCLLEQLEQCLCLFVSDHGEHFLTCIANYLLTENKVVPYALPRLL